MIERDFSKLSPEFCLRHANAIVEKYPFSEAGNASGKFFNNYRCWHFHRQSTNPLVQLVVRSLEDARSSFSQIFNKPLHFEFIILTLVEDCSEEMCLWHKDGYFFDGQFHLTIEGGANIAVRDDEGMEKLITKSSGQLWYLNGSRFYHRIQPSRGRRLEVCIPVNQRQEDVKRKIQAMDGDPLGLLRGDSPEWQNLRQEQAQYVREAVARGSASNLEIAGFSIDADLKGHKT